VSIGNAGTYNGTITTVSSGGCSEETRTIEITVTQPTITAVVPTDQGNTNDGTTNSGTTTNTNTSTTTNNSTATRTFNIDVTASNSSDYTLSGSDRNGSVSGNDPNLTFNLGDSINFNVNAAGHPFYLKTAAGTGTGNLISGITNNGTENATITWTADNRGTYYYQCSLHGGMVGTITIQ